MSASPTPRGALALGFCGIAILLGGIAFWAAQTQISGAVVAPGVIEVEIDSQVVQHPDGGVVDEILARNGDRVSAGDVLVRLDGTFQRSELAVLEGQLAEIFARKMRLRAERDGSPDMLVDEVPEFHLLAPEDVAEQIEGQTALFDARRVSLAREKDQLIQQQEQINQQIDGLRAQLRSAVRQRDLFQGELEDVQSLFDRGLVQVNRLLELQRAEAELEGRVGAFISQIAEARTRIAEIELQILRLADTRREEVITQIRELAFSERELLERRGSLVEQLGRLDILAPLGGAVFDSQVFAQRSVVQPAEPVMYIVPEDQPLHVSARVDPVDVDQVYAGQDVTLVFSAFSRRTTPEGAGTVRFVSADARTDPATGLTYYEAIVTITDATREALSGLALLPGMPVETYIRTDERTPLSYLVQPIAVYFSRAFREE